MKIWALRQIHFIIIIYYTRGSVHKRANGILYPDGFHFHFVALFRIDTQSGNQDLKYQFSVLSVFIDTNNMHQYRFDGVSARTLLTPQENQTSNVINTVFRHNSHKNPFY